MNPLQSPVFVERVSFLNDSEFWPEKRMRIFQRQKLSWIIDHVWNHVPFYRNFMNANGLQPSNIRRIEDLSLFPLIDKPLIQQDYDAFIPDYLRRSALKHRTTGGSTGTPLTVYSDDDFFARDKANTEYYMNVAGLDIFSHRSVRLYGDRIDEKILEAGEFGYVRDERQLVMSCFHINLETAAKYLETMASFSPAYIHTRPSSILPLARAMNQLDLEPGFPLQAIFCDGEYLTKGQRDIIQKAFSCRLMNIFGHTEGSAVGITCKESDHLHFLPQVGIIEILDSEGNQVTQQGEKGELVVTGFNNPIFPLIRYRTGDIVVKGPSSCTCGRPYPLVQHIEGRIQDYIVDRNDTLVPLAPAVFNYNDMDWRGIHEFKVFQKAPGKLHIKIVPENKNDSERICDYVSERITAILGNGFDVTVEQVDYLEKTRIGKFRYLDQALDLSGFFREETL